MHLNACRYDALYELVDYDEQAEDFVHRPFENTILVPLGLLAIPLYSCDATDAVNIGGLGGAFARYLVKGFRLASNVSDNCTELPLQVHEHRQ
ncbi:hypothetical protein V5799_008313 [Amblyomma americanum]|uniref:Uncharacterized protein n=1 Tax=Amblyomma americanum TaxID=6943 RepID=A0AAQ4FF90_AMBAM